MRVVDCGSTALPNRERWIAAAVLVLLVVLRSIVFVFWEQSFFDSDQAITGLMAKHLIEGRAFPVFFYGQNHMLGVDAYLAAPVFAVAGVSVTTLKLPLLVLNIGVALLLLRTLEREVGLRPYLALVPVLFFALPSPAAASEMLAPYGGSFAPFVYTLLIWRTRARPGWCGAVFGFGFLHREFTLYALLALIAVEATEGALLTWEGVRRRVAMFRTAAAVWLVVHVLKVLLVGRGSRDVDGGFCCGRATAYSSWRTGGAETSHRCRPASSSSLRNTGRSCLAPVPCRSTTSR